MTAVTARDLLGAAAELRAAAVADDGEALHGALLRLRNQLGEHARRSERELGTLPGAVPAVVRGGQERLLALVDALLFSAEGETGSCACLVRSADLEARLRRQARLEASTLPGARRRRSAADLRPVDDG